MERSGAFAAAELLLWQGKTDEASREIAHALAEVAGAEFAFYLAPLYALGVWAAVDRALRARAQRRDADAQQATHDAIDVYERLLVRRSTTTGPEVQAWAEHAAAELSRLESNQRGVDAWSAARASWDTAALPVSGCVLRVAPIGGAHHVPLRSHTCWQSLSLAHTTARALGARPLVDEIALLARRARLSLTERHTVARHVIVAEDVRRARASSTYCD